MDISPAEYAAVNDLLEELRILGYKSKRAQIEFLALIIYVLTRKE